MDGGSADAEVIADRPQGAHGVRQLGHAAEAAAGAALQGALARQRQGLLGHGLQHHVHGHAFLALLDGDVLDVGDLGDGFGEGESDRQVLEILGRGHHHRVRPVVVRDADRGLVRGDALDLAHLGAADAPLQALTLDSGGEAFHPLSSSLGR